LWCESRQSSKIWRIQGGLLLKTAVFCFAYLFFVLHMPVSLAGNSSSAPHASFEIKSAQLPLVTLLVKTNDWDVLASEIKQQFGADGENPDFFDHDALVVDFSHLDTSTPATNLVPLLKILRACNLVPVAIRGASPHWTASALEIGLVEASAEVHRPRPLYEASAPAETVIREVVQEVIREIPGPVTMVVDKPLRSGQKIYARGADLVVLAMVNQGAEVVADGNIHVYAPLRGKAMAGARGNTNARIFSLCLEPELISIAGIYRTSENALPPDVHGKAAQVRLSNDGQDKLLIEALKI
jgi:septum site-determining protein MinC